MSERGVGPSLVRLALLTPKEGKFVCGVAYSSDGYLWVGYKNCVAKIDQSGKIVMEVKTRAGKYCNHLACMCNGDLLISYGGLSYIDKVTREGVFGDFSNLSPYKCYDIVVSKTNQVGACLKGFNMAVISEKGELLSRVKLGKMSGFTLSQDDHYLTIDCGNGMSLVTLDESGRHVREAFKVDQRWNIERLVCDRYGNIIGLNDQKEVYAISPTGALLHKYTIQTGKKETINCMAVDPDSNLILGTSEGNITIERYIQ